MGILRNCTSELVQTKFYDHPPGFQVNRSDETCQRGKSFNSKIASEDNLGSFSEVLQSRIADTLGITSRSPEPDIQDSCGAGNLPTWMCCHLAGYNESPSLLLRTKDDPYQLKDAWHS